MALAVAEQVERLMPMREDGVRSVREVDAQVGILPPSRAEAGDVLAGQNRELVRSAGDFLERAAAPQDRRAADQVIELREDEPGRNR